MKKLFFPEHTKSPYRLSQYTLENSKNRVRDYTEIFKNNKRHSLLLQLGADTPEAQQDMSFLINAYEEKMSSLLGMEETLYQQAEEQVVDPSLLSQLKITAVLIAEIAGFLDTPVPTIRPVLAASAPGIYGYPITPIILDKDTPAELQEMIVEHVPLQHRDYFPIFTMQSSIRESIHELFHTHAAVEYVYCGEKMNEDALALSQYSHQRIDSAQPIHTILQGFQEHISRVLSYAPFPLSSTPISLYSSSKEALEIMYFRSENIAPEDDPILSLLQNEHIDLHSAQDGIVQSYPLNPKLIINGSNNSLVHYYAKKALAHRPLVLTHDSEKPSFRDLPSLPPLENFYTSLEHHDHIRAVLQESVNAAFHHSILPEPEKIDPPLRTQKNISTFLALPQKFRKKLTSLV